jgi:hypothetical protein
MRAVFGAALAYCVVALGACSSAVGSEPTNQSEPSPYPVTPVVSSNAVMLEFDSEDALATAAPSVRVGSLMAGGQQLVQVPSGNGTSALQFPPYAPQEAGRLVLVLSSVGRPDRLNPVRSDFSFGADVRLDATSSGDADDNGDNVLQRGLFNDPNQYKLQVDKRVPSCTVKVGAARLFVKLDSELDGGWFRVRCDYQAGTLTVSASRIDANSVTEFSRASVSQKLGGVEFAVSTQVTVGGKLGSNGDLVLRESDQFNGDLDNVFVDIPSSAS